MQLSLCGGWSTHAIHGAVNNVRSQAHAYAVAQMGRARRSIIFHVVYGCLLEVESQQSKAKQDSAVTKFVIEPGNDLLHHFSIAGEYKDVPEKGAKVSPVPAKYLPDEFVVMRNIGGDFGFRGVLN